jgi:threonine/homoserine/homoserine lactone efflux protein
VDWAYAIASGLRHRAGVMPAVSGMLAGHLTATFIVAAGVAALLAASDVAMTLLTGAGAAYLIWLGASALRHPATPDLESQSAPSGQGRLFAKGIGISLLNPKVFLLFLALLPQFTNASASWPVGMQMIVLGVLHVINCAIVYFAVGYGAAVVLTRRPKAAKIVGILSGIVMIGLGLALITEKLITIAT